MGVIHLGERAPVPVTRRVRLGAGGMLELQRALARSETGVRLPEELQVHVDDAARARAGADPATDLAEVTAALVERGVLTDADPATGAVPVEAVLANLAALVSAPNRVRVSLAGSGQVLLAHYWVDARLGGSLVRDGNVWELALFDARLLGEELLRPLPRTDAGPDAGRRGGGALRVPLASLATVAALADDLDADVAAAVEDLLGAGVDDSVRRWVRDVRAVLHVTVPATDPGRLPGMLVWFLGRDGWWQARTEHRDVGAPTVVVRPVPATGLGAELGSLVEGVWG